MLLPDWYGERGQVIMPLQREGDTAPLLDPAQDCGFVFPQQRSRRSHRDHVRRPEGGQHALSPLLQQGANSVGRNLARADCVRCSSLIHARIVEQQLLSGVTVTDADRTAERGQRRVPSAVAAHDLCRQRVA